MSKRRAGLALPAVLWTLAALSLLLGGMVRFARVETQLSATLLARQRADAYLQAGITYAVAALEQDPRLTNSPPLQTQIVLDEQAIGIEIVNVAGLVDINFASEALLLQLLQVSLGWSAERAQALVQARQARPQPAYVALADLRRAAAFTEQEWQLLQPLVTVHAGRSGVNVLLAPLQVLTLLRPDNPRAVAAFDAARRRQPDLADLTLIGSVHHQTLPVRAFRVDVSVALPDGHRFARRYWVAQQRMPPSQLGIVDRQDLPTS